MRATPLPLGLGLGYGPSSPSVIISIVSGHPPPLLPPRMGRMGRQWPQVEFVALVVPTGGASCERSTEPYHSSSAAAIWRGGGDGDGGLHGGSDSRGLPHAYSLSSSSGGGGGGARHVKRSGRWRRTSGCERTTRLGCQLGPTLIL